VAANALGAQLNRRQRIFDFVREAARHFAPGRNFLRANQRRDVVDDEDHAVGTF
jgi:hypothetical protein